MTIVVRCTCPLGGPGAGQHKDRVQVSVLSFTPQARALGIEAFGVSGLGGIYDNPTRSLLSDLTCCAGRLQSWQCFPVPYKEDLGYVRYVAHVEWAGMRPSQEQELETEQREKMAVFSRVPSVSLSHSHPVWPSTVVRVVQCIGKFGQGAALGVKYRYTPESPRLFLQLLRSLHARECILTRALCRLSGVLSLPWVLMILGGRWQGRRGLHAEGRLPGAGCCRASSKKRLEVFYHLLAPPLVSATIICTPSLLWKPAPCPTVSWASRGPPLRRLARTGRRPGCPT